MSTEQLKKEIPAAAAKPGSRWAWKNLKGKFLIISIALHVGLALIATWLVVTTLTPRKQDFKAPPAAAAPNRVVEHKIDMVKKQNTMSAPAQAKRIATTGLSKVALPEMPDMPTVDSVTPNAMSGMGGPGVAFGGAGMPGGGGGGGGMTLFGLREAGAGLEGNFYDFKRSSKNKPNDKMLSFPEIVRTFARGDFGPKGMKHYRSPAKLYAKTFLFPGIRDTEAGVAFQAPETGPGGWLAHYKGTFISQVDGLYRFVGFGDNVMIVKLDSSTVLDASDKDFLGRKRELKGTLNMGAKKGAGIFEGSWFNLSRGQSKKIEIVVGDEGGIFCAGVFLQKQGEKYQPDANGVPVLPLFVVGALGADQKAALQKFIPESAFSGPAFTLGKSSLLGN